jgi:hypothetical protein
MNLKKLILIIPTLNTKTIPHQIYLKILKFSIWNHYKFIKFFGNTKINLMV